MSIRNSKSFLLTFWYRPAYSTRQLLIFHQGHISAMLVAAVMGMVQFSRLLPVPSENLWVHLLLYGFGGIVGLFLFGWLVCNFGRWFGAEAEQRAVRTALGLGILPWTIIFGILLLMLNLGFDPESIAEKYFPFVLGAFIYGFCILLLSLTVALRLSIIRTFLCMVFTCLLSFFPLTLLAQFLSEYLN